MEEQYIRNRALTFLQKNKDYGDSFKESLDEFGIIAYKVRVMDKLKRLNQLINSEDRLVKDESVEDTFNDMLIYSAMASAWENKKYNLQVIVNEIYLFVDSFQSDKNMLISYLINHELLDNFEDNFISELRILSLEIIKP